jgi:hypothetical protein
MDLSQRSIYANLSVHQYPRNWSVIRIMISNLSHYPRSSGRLLQLVNLPCFYSWWEDKQSRTDYASFYERKSVGLLEGYRFTN